MGALAVTIFVSLLLAILFVVGFAAESRLRGRRGGLEQEALLPFDDDEPATRPDRPAGRPAD